MTAWGEPPSATELAKETQNPVANLISVPFQYNTGFNFGSRDRTQHILNIQPVIPISLGEDLNLITRTIIPIVSQPSLAPGQDRRNGLGDTSLSLFVSPKAPAFGSLIWGVGPIVNIPTASDELLGRDRWGTGITGVGLVIEGPIVAGLLVSNTWSLEGEDFSAFLIQQILNYNLPGGWYLRSGPIITADWEGDHDEWLVPVGGGLGKVHRFGELPVNMRFEAFYNVEKPEGGADWSTRLEVSFLFPK